MGVRRHRIHRFRRMECIVITFQIFKTQFFSKDVPYVPSLSHLRFELFPFFSLLCPIVPSFSPIALTGEDIRNEGHTPNRPVRINTNRHGTWDRRDGLEIASRNFRVRHPKKFVSMRVENFSSSIFSALLIDSDFRPTESLQPMKTLESRLLAPRNQAANRFRQEFIRFLGCASRGLSIRTISQSIQNFCSPASDLVDSRPSFKKLAQEKFSHAKRFEKFSSFNFCVRSVGLVEFVPSSWSTPWKFLPRVLKGRNS
jgi:hypothetical protein